MKLHHIVAYSIAIHRTVTLETVTEVLCRHWLFTNLWKCLKYQNSRRILKNEHCKNLSL